MTKPNALWKCFKFWGGEGEGRSDLTCLFKVLAMLHYVSNTGNRNSLASEQCIKSFLAIEQFQYKTQIFASINPIQKYHDSKHMLSDWIGRLTDKQCQLAKMSAMQKPI